MALCTANSAGAQESLDSGKTPAQLFALDCVICHKSPQGLAKSGGFLGLDSFLRQHYTASRESAGAIANYLKAVGDAPATSARGPAKKRPAKGDDKPKAGETKPADGKALESKPGESKPSEPKPSEAKAPDAKPSEPKAAEPAPAPSPKSE
ncbi:MAG: hypothetical protein EXQ82_05235 [Pseudolabrys sp.]|nr:hypothetical protein [Pseudolabrys sp.]